MAVNLWTSEILHKLLARTMINKLQSIGTDESRARLCQSYLIFEWRKAGKNVWNTDLHKSKGNNIDVTGSEERRAL